MGQHRKLGRNTTQRMAMLRNMATSLLKYGKIETTEPKAKEVRKLTEKMITLGKRGDLHAYRQALAFLKEETVVKKLFDEIAPNTYTRSSGFTRIVKLKNRLGDGAEIVQVELLK